MFGLPGEHAQKIEYECPENSKDFSANTAIPTSKKAIIESEQLERQLHIPALNAKSA